MSTSGVTVQKWSRTPGKLGHETNHQVDGNILKVGTVESEGQGQRYQTRNIRDTTAPCEHKYPKLHSAL
jgi:hypothetical protein